MIISHLAPEDIVSLSHVSRLFALELNTNKAWRLLLRNVMQKKEYPFKKINLTVRQQVLWHLDKLSITYCNKCKKSHGLILATAKHGNFFNRICLACDKIENRVNGRYMKKVGAKQAMKIFLLSTEDVLKQWAFQHRHLLRQEGGRREWAPICHLRDLNDFKDSFLGWYTAAARKERNFRFRKPLCYKVQLV